MNNAYIPISEFKLALSMILILITGTISALLQLGLLKSLVWGTVRAFVQLSIIGSVLMYVFKIDNLAVILVIILLMCWVASREAIRRTPEAPFNTSVVSFLALTASTFIVGLIVVVIIISPEPWYSARISVPIFGMILGNSMNGIALSLDRMLSEVKAHIEEIEQLVCFGATPWEAIVPYVRKAVMAGMTPTINGLMVVGLVSLPGMMTGQILAGMDPTEAVRYQFVVMAMVAAAVGIGCLIIVLLSYRRLFNQDQALVQPAYYSQRPRHNAGKNKLK
ncbi:MAG: iron export ABC transporter permease subunit FetB [Syntrophothermus sp.]|uniref:ABC transporter permease n=1 Tax=Syntrophothermus sp. TaxID=2736299 RepID=UPI00257E59D3|nr:iron export ABC transporter permease subunit FetB [Syntrophothermus sp.]NSW84527.1 iron export ABC transporter permease subunit FetB [Syntrophothermus sp.]